ncbi:MAG: hypothetical protein JSR32_10130 [Proteobacteria bacterium]|nr:hypothetical protein [Pseudomonadota bacterium]
MKSSQFLLVVAIKICFILFGVIPLISILLFGTMPTLSQFATIVSWMELNVVNGSVLLGIVVFLSYLVVAKLYAMPKSKARFSSVKFTA